MAGFSAPAVPLLLQGYWLLLLQWALIALIVAACWFPDAAFRIFTFLAACLQSLIRGASWGSSRLQLDVSAHQSVLGAEPVHRVGISCLQRLNTRSIDAQHQWIFLGSTGEPLPEVPQLRASASTPIQAVQETHLQATVRGSLSSKWRLTLLRAELVDDFWVGEHFSVHLHMSLGCTVVYCHPYLAVMAARLLPHRQSMSTVWFSTA